MSTQPWQRPPCPPNTEDGRTDGRRDHRRYFYPSFKVDGWPSLLQLFKNIQPSHWLKLSHCIFLTHFYSTDVGFHKPTICPTISWQFSGFLLPASTQSPRLTLRATQDFGASFFFFFFLMSNILCHQRWTFYVQRLPRLRWRGAAESDSG